MKSFALPFSLKSMPVVVLFVGASLFLSAQTTPSTPPRAYPALTQASFKPDPHDALREQAMLPTLYSSSHGSQLLRLRNGDVLCFWFSGSNEGDANVGIVSARLKRGSDHWEAAQLIDRTPQKSYQNPVGYEAADGTLIVYHSSQSAGKGQADAVVLRNLSHDGGRSWSASEPVFTKAGAFTRQPLVGRGDGAQLLPIFYSTVGGITEGAETNYSAVEVSRDEGKSWQECLMAGSEGLVHPALVPAGKAGYLAFFRSRYADHIFRATSADGCHWSHPVATALPNNNASIGVIRLRNNDLAMVFNNTSGHDPRHISQMGKRAPLSIALSSDNGLSWRAVRDLEVPDAQLPEGEKPSGIEEYSYPSLRQMEDGRLLICYTYRRLTIKSLLIDEAWVRKGSTVGEYKP